MTRRHTSLVPLLALVFAPASVGAQDVDVELSLVQSFSEIGAMSSPLGFRLGVTRHGLVGPLGIQGSFERVSESSVDEDGFCGFASCHQGPLDTSTAFWTTRAGVVVESPQDRPVQVGVGVTALLASFSQSSRSRSTDDVVDSGSAGPSLGFGASLQVRVATGVSGLRPYLFGHLERIGSESCLQDASCYFPRARTVSAIGLGVAWDGVR